MSRHRKGVAAGGLCAGRAALQGLPAGHAGLQHHPWHTLVRLAVRLKDQGNASLRCLSS